MTTTLVQTGLAALLTTLFVIGAPSAPVVTLIVAGGIASALGSRRSKPCSPTSCRKKTSRSGRVVFGPVQPRPRGRPRVAGIVVAIGGCAWALGVNAASFLAVVFVLLTLRLRRRRRRPKAKHCGRR
jgi:membrane protein implicated in regulation of membrane protease activity